ncbi:hypothetical protein MP228_004248 [Amoeboaphelidium protococcarum]|nr:hypothetical protein MP228_004248 [Amoeboaphelidium protococcarum]
MGFAHNNMLPNNHFRKDWQRRVKTWFNQPARKIRRRQARAEKAAAIAPRPVDGLLRPIVRCPTVRYNMKVRKGRGFTLDEIKAAGFKNALEARNTYGVAVDHRRRSSGRSVEGFAVNVDRLKAYKAKIVLLPKKRSKNSKRGSPMAVDVPAADKLVKRVNADVHSKAVSIRGAVVEYGNVADFKSEESVYAKLRKAQSDAKLVGVREKRAKAKEEEEAAKKK